MVNNWVSNLYSGSKLVAKYTFSDNDTTEQSLIANLLGLNSAATIASVDIDDQITVEQVAATISGTNLDLTIGAQIRYGVVNLRMLSYSPSVTPTFNVPNLTEFFNSGMPLGSVTFDLLRTV